MPTVARRVEYDVQLIAEDMADRGWNRFDLSRFAKISAPTTTRFLRGEVQTVKVAGKIAKALGNPISRYVIRTRKVA